MVAPTDRAEKPRPTTGNRVSKPLMEKKRRARINKCLDQLKVLLENYYSSSIRKRKLEKADILELTVKHLKNLQMNPRFTSPSAEFSEFKIGFHSCLANFHQYLLMAENLSGRDRSMLSRLSAKLCSSQERRDLSSTMDSNRVPADSRDEPRRPLPSAFWAEETNKNTLKHHKSRPSYCSQDQRQSTKHVRENCASVAKPPSSRTGAATIQSSVWRPW